MPSLKVIRKRISSVKSTQKITRAMKMVAGARLNRAQQRIVALRPYAVKTGEILQSVAAQAGAGGDDGEALHPLLARRAEKNVLIVVLSADRGLCGAFNTNINKTSEREWRARAGEATVSFVTLGRKGREFLSRRGGTIAHDFPKIYDGLDMDKARHVAEWIVPRFKRGEFDAVYLVYNEFKSAITQKTNFEQLLPLPAPPETESKGAAGATASTEFLFEPNRAALLERLVPMYVEISLFRALLESQASFFGAQMTAMDAATRNAKEMIGRLTLVYNRARQAAITKELMEIIGGAEALKE
ncbi:MAG TPA: ATP synthase F1 subunit gamma [Polyangiaceae bacterium]|jgi:F-type H+-transporting ATPase subunit gamma